MIEVLLISIVFGLIITGMVLSLIGTIGYCDEPQGVLYLIEFILCTAGLIALLMAVSGIIE